MDGSYVLIQNGQEILYGEAYQIQDGNIRKICEKDSSVVLK